MEVATRTGGREFVHGLARCIDRDLSMPAVERTRWQAIKNKGLALYHPAKGGSYEVFNERPLHPDMLAYCGGDVAKLPELYQVYRAKLSPPGQAFWRHELKLATEARVQASQAPGYEPHSQTKARSPWNDNYIQSARKRWNQAVKNKPPNDSSKSKA